MWAAILHEKKQDIILDGCQLHTLSIHRHFLGVIIDAQPAYLKKSIVLRIQIPQRRISPHRNLSAAGRVYDL